MSNFLKLSELLSFAKNELKLANIPSPQIDSLLLICKAFSLTKEQVIFNPDLAINQNQINDFQALLKRRLSREPMSHIIGKREFFGNDFLVSSSVLDPRPDSESLIELIGEIFPDKNSKLKILELGVGSGCLILTALKLFSNWNGIGVDISEKALEMAQKNAHLLEIQNRIQLSKSNWFENISSEKFDLIISNPPYIASAEIETLQEEVKNHEPRNALDGGISGLDCYEEIAKNVGNFLKNKGILILEIGQNQEISVQEIFEKNGLKLIKTKKDLGGIIRSLAFTNE